MWFATLGWLRAADVGGDVASAFALERGIELGVSTNQQDGGEPGREVIHFAYVEQAKIEFIELIPLGKCG